MNTLEIFGAFVVELQLHQDNRGEFAETFRLEWFDQCVERPAFVQDSRAVSRSGVLRGLHYQKKRPKGLFVQAVRGSVLDVGVDLRRASPTFRVVSSVMLDSRKPQGVYWPPGVAHGYWSLEDLSELLYKSTAYYDQLDERGLNWRDPLVKALWPKGNPITIERDANFPFFHEISELDLPTS